MNILNKIHSSEDIKKLKTDELPVLAEEIRHFLVQSISKTGGHLASNLGAVELTIALHRVYDTKVDRLVFDVGHQSYVHKIITGRKDRFNTLRQYGGLSGFPKPNESPDDAFIAGHASNSVSVAVGMAKARTALGQNYDVAAIIGDGALTGGLAYEGLAAAAASREPMVIILNDNNMSIDPNVGGTVSILQEMRIRPGYIRFKRWYRDVLSHTPAVYQFNHHIKERIKGKLLPSNMFSAMGLNYLGPVDGHNIEELETVLRLARDHQEPVLVHVLTKKGKGCSFAEEHPEIYHGVGKFDPYTGEIPAGAKSFSDCFGETICEIANKDKRVVGLTAAMCIGTGMECFAQQFPKRFIDVGIAEGCAASLASGMAKQGLVPVFAVYSSFLQRSYDMLIHDVSLLHLHVVICVDRAGLVGSDGETHHGMFDVAYLRSIPAMKIFAPASFSELKEMITFAAEQYDGPVAVRYPRGGECSYTDNHIARETILRYGTDITIVSYGTLISEALEASEQMDKLGISAEVIKLSELDGDYYPLVMESLRKTKRMIAVEEVCAVGSMGTVLAAEALYEGIAVTARYLNLGSGIVVHGDREKLMDVYGINSRAIVSTAREMTDVRYST